MKKIAVSVLIAILMIVLIAEGCGKSKQEKAAERLLKEMVSCNTYSGEIKQGEDGLPVHLKQYFSEEGYKKFVAGEMGYVYPEFFKYMKVKTTQNININRIRKIRHRTDTEYKYSVEYIAAAKGKKMKMRDLIVIRVDKKSQIADVVVLNKSDIMQKLFLDIKVM